MGMADAGTPQAIADTQGKESAWDIPRLHQLFEAQAERTPDAIAVTHGSEQLSYRQLNEKANQLAGYLRRLGVETETLVGIGLSRSPMMLIALLAVWKAGGAYVPLDPAYPRERLAFMIQDAGLGLVLTDASTHALFSGIPMEADIRPPEYLCLNNHWPQIAKGDSANLADTTDANGLCYVTYTSGSTGKPKGAMVLHKGLTNYVTWAVEAYGIRPGGSVPVHSSLSFDLTVTSLYPPLLAGAEVELLNEADGVHGLVEALRARKRNLVKITPAHLDLLNQELRVDELAQITDAFIIGGENLTADRLEIWRLHAPQTRLINEYGPTETVVGCCTHEVRPDHAHAGSIPIGRPIANTQLHVLDSDLRPVAPGTIGELYIGGAGVARGYLNRPQLTQAHFLPDPFTDRPDARLYRTGDLARYAETGNGVLEYLGRVDHQVKIQGYRIELGEIEYALASHSQVRACAVLVQDTNPSEKALIAFVVPQGDSLDTASLMKDLGEQLPHYMKPSRIISVKNLPLTSNGKVDRNVLLAMTEDKIAEAHQDIELPVPRIPRTRTETLVADVFEDVLQRSNIELSADFFDLGGRSLSATRLMMKLRIATEMDLPLRMLYENPSIEKLAAELDARIWAAAPAANPALDQSREALTL